MPGDGPHVTERKGQRSVESLLPLSDAGLSDDGAWALLDAAPDGIIMADESGQILLVNRQTEELFGYDRADLLGRSVDELLPEPLRQVHRAHRIRYRAEPRTRAMGAGARLFGRHADGSDFPVEISLSPMTTEDGLRVVAAVRDISQRVELEARTADVFETLDAITDGVFIFDAETLRFTYVNQGAIAQVGYPRDELLGMTMLHIAPELSESSFRALLADLLRSDPPARTFTTAHRRRDGTDVPVEITMEARRGSDGKPRRYIQVVRDIRDRLQADERLRRAEQDLLVSEDRDRIARDLHDRTIQRLFAAGMTLQGVQTRLQDPALTARVEKVTDDLDDTIRELRSVIFGLHRRVDDSDLRSEILRIVGDERQALGFEPEVHFEGLIEMISAPIARELLPTLREALSNVARHAHASSVRVVVACTDDSVSLRVLDDGDGVLDDVVPGNGTRNLAERAAGLGGDCRLVDRPGGGALLEWSVPNRS